MLPHQSTTSMKHHDPLDEIIASWKEVPPGKPDLRRRVWARIDLSESNRLPAAAPFWLNIFDTLVRHRAALGWVAACIALGLLSAEIRATRTQVSDLGQMASIYLKSINPLLRDNGGQAK
jgi:hypothetical protein